MKMIALNIEDQNYPERLKQTVGAPENLYCVGNLEMLKKQSLAIVGTRWATAYGESQAFEFGKEFSRHGVAVVSGLAYGIDGAAHRGALEGEGGTIAVLAQGLANISPSKHISLAKKILEKGGLLVSENKEGKIYKDEFLKRNRIISGLSEAVLVVEAPHRSGALNTVKHANTQGRYVAALPGRITDEKSQGTNRLLREGAIFPSSPQDLAKCLGMDWEVNIRDELEGLIKAIYEDILAYPKTASELVEKYNEPPEKIYEIIFALESNGLIKVSTGMRYAASVTRVTSSKVDMP